MMGRKKYADSRLQRWVRVELHNDDVVFEETIKQYLASECE